MDSKVFVWIHLSFGVQPLSKDINNDTETSQSADSKRFEPLKKGLEETPLDVRDQQDFPNNI